MGHRAAGSGHRADAVLHACTHVLGFFSVRTCQNIFFTFIKIETFVYFPAKTSTNCSELHLCVYERGTRPFIHTEAMPIPAHVVARGMQELNASCAHMLTQCFRLHAAGRMPEASVDTVLRSVAWQSPALAEYYAWLDARAAAPALLSEEDLRLLMLQ